jgi:outer membrane biosynthesis protein TonB
MHISLLLVRFFRGRIDMFISLRKTISWVGLLTLGIAVFVLEPGIRAQEKSDRKVVKKVEPIYPPIAGKLHLTGVVKMVLQVTPEGKVASLHTVGGNPILVVAAEGAVKQWKYEAAPKESNEIATVTFDAPK